MTAPTTLYALRANRRYELDWISPGLGDDSGEARPGDLVGAWQINTFDAGLALLRAAEEALDTLQEVRVSDALWPGARALITPTATGFAVYFDLSGRA